MLATGAQQAWPSRRLGVQKQGTAAGGLRAISSDSALKLSAVSDVAKRSCASRAEPGSDPLLLRVARGEGVLWLIRATLHSHSFR